MKKLLTSILILALCIVEIHATETVTSPDGRNTFSFSQENGLFYTISRDGKTIVERSEMGISIDNHLFESALGIPNEERKFWGENWCRNLNFVEAKRDTVSSSWAAPYGEWNEIPDCYNEMTLCFRKGQNEELREGVSGTSYVKSKCYFFNIKVRAYNEGIAFCYEFPETSNGLFLNILDEKTEFRMPQGTKALCTAWAQGRYTWRELSEPWNEEVERPLTMRLTDGTAVSLLEARCVDYARTKMVLKGNGIIRLRPYDGVEVMTPFATPWRLLMVGDKMTDLCNHDYMVLNLNAPMQSIFELGEGTCDEWQWVKPGKVFRSGLKKSELKKAIDFCAARNFQYVHLDAGWYGPEMYMASSACSVAKNHDFTIREITAYAKEKGIGVFVYVNQRALYKELDNVLDSLAAWGVKGVKFGFVQVGNQMWTTWLHEAIKKCAERKLMVNIHDEYRPTGFSRSFPNLMTAEGLAGNEEMPDAAHNVTLPFTRFLCGPADYTLCYYNSRVKCTKAHQLAMAAVYYSPLTWMFWYDKPDMYKGEPELEFWEQIPTVWDDTKVLQGEPEEYIVTARRSGETWYVGSLNGLRARTLTLPLDFLEKGVKYVAYLYEDDPDIEKDIDNGKIRAAKRTKVRCTKKNVTCKTVLTLPLIEKGGVAIKIEKHRM